MDEMRLSKILGYLVGLCTLALACGQELPLPPQPEPSRIPTPGTFNLDRIWEISSPTDMVLHGSYLYVIEEEQRLTVYLSDQASPRKPGFIEEFEGLVRPVQICLAKRDSTFVFVADAGDQTIKRYYFRGGPPLFSFTDSSWVEFSGIAADYELNVYLADAVRDTIYKYDSDGRPVRLVSDYGTGQGFVIDPHGLAYVNDALWVADTGKNWVQRIDPDSTNLALNGDPIGLEVELRNPTDVAADLAGETIYANALQDTFVLRFQATGALIDTVYSTHREETQLDPPLGLIRHFAADDERVFLPDPENDRIVILRLTSQ